MIDSHHDRTPLRACTTRNRKTNGSPAPRESRGPFADSKRAVAAPLRGRSGARRAARAWRESAVAADSVSVGRGHCYGTVAFPTTVGEAARSNDDRKKKKTPETITRKTMVKY